MLVLVVDLVFNQQLVYSVIINAHVVMNCLHMTNSLLIIVCIVKEGEFHFRTWSSYIDHLKEMMKKLSSCSSTMKSSSIYATPLKNWYYLMHQFLIWIHYVF